MFSDSLINGTKATVTYHFS